MTQSFLLRNTCHYISLSFIKSLNLANEIHEIRSHRYVNTFEKEVQEIYKIIPPPWPDPEYKNNKNLFIEGDLQKEVNHHSS